LSRFPEGLSCVYYNVEQQFDKVFVERQGVNVDDLTIVDTTAIEEVGENLENLVPVANVHVIDSCSSGIALAELNMEVEEQRRGVSAKQWGLMLRRASKRFTPDNMGIIVDQVRINQRTGSEEPPGGKYLEHTSSMTVHFKRGTWLYKDKDGYLTDDADTIRTLSGAKEPDGLEFQARVDKSRVGRPFRTARMRLDFDGMGYDIPFEQITAAIHYGVVRKNGSWYYTLDDDGEDVQSFHGTKKLRAHLEENEQLQQKIMDVWRSHTKN
jgi:recombination protein RecA